MAWLRMPTFSFSDRPLILRPSSSSSSSVGVTAEQNEPTPEPARAEGESERGRNKHPNGSFCSSSFASSSPSSSSSTSSFLSCLAAALCLRRGVCLWFAVRSSRCLHLPRCAGGTSWADHSSTHVTIVPAQSSSGFDLKRWSSSLRSAGNSPEGCALHCASTSPPRSAAPGTATARAPKDWLRWL